MYVQTGFGIKLPFWVDIALNQVKLEMKNRETII